MIDKEKEERLEKWALNCQQDCNESMQYEMSVRGSDNNYSMCEYCLRRMIIRELAYGVTDD